MESDDEWITEKEDPCLPEDHSWMDIQECFEDDKGATSSKKRKTGPRNLNAADRGKRKVFEDDDEVELIERGEEEEEEEEEEEFDEMTMGWWLLSNKVVLTTAAVNANCIRRYRVLRGAKKQKHVFKKNPKAPIWGVPPKVIGGKLLASVYW
ncbi:hypothetical protein HYC85_021819 [Camellia sinensis]|uniref:Uncharacterized protein n=1 Tax=Camellia sinensis TaxID=4442 RepID=A0A7J7GIM7_CAMSI|nr:hypothetical protein HYC85_021819 [Camellia sinensis]